MKNAEFAVLLGLAALCLCLLLWAASSSDAIPYLARLEAGERGIVREMLEKGMAPDLDNYHLCAAHAAGVTLPVAPAHAGALAHPQAERFFYVNGEGEMVLKGLSDQNVPPDYSQKCLLFVDASLSWFRMRTLFQALVDANIRYAYLGALTPDGRLSYTLFEVIGLSAFELFYPYRIVMLDDRTVYLYCEEEEDDSQEPGESAMFVRIADSGAFQKVAQRVRRNSPAKKPFVRFLAMDNVTCRAFCHTLAMCAPNSLQAIIKLRDDNRIFILSEVADHHAPPQEEKEQE